MTQHSHVVDNAERHRYEILVDGQVAGYLDHRSPREGVIELPHTVVEDAFAGRGLASVLVRHALDAARAAGLRVVPTCPYVRGWIAKHPDYAALVTPVVEVVEGAAAQVGNFGVQRVLPRRGRRLVGAWCFADHMGPADVDAERSPGVGPHPHCGLATVTWLLDGELLHRDSLGSEQPIRPGQLNLMTAGHGVQHAEEGTGYAGLFEGIQLWVAQPDATRSGPAAFEHHAELPRIDLGAGTGTVLLGEFAGAESPARRDTELVGVDLRLHGTADLPLRTDFEYALVGLRGGVEVDGVRLGPGQLAYLGAGADELRVRVPERGRAMLLGGVPLTEPVLMFWNFVGRDRAELAEAGRAWNDGSDRFGRLDSPLPRYAAPEAPWPA